MADSNDPPKKDNEEDTSSGGASIGLRVLVGVGFLAVAGSLWWFFRDSLTLENLAEQESAIRRWRDQNPWLCYGAAFLIYVAVTGLSIPGAAPLTLAYAWFFGFWPALVLVSFASTTGATLAFLTSRFVLRDFIQSNFGSRLEAFNEALEKEGAFYLFTLRLIPAVPFFVINAVMGLTGLPVWTYWWVSQVGMLPGTIAYCWAGASVPDLNRLQKQGVSSVLSWELLAAFVVLGLLPITLKKVVQWATNRDIDEDPVGEASHAADEDDDHTSSRNDDLQNEPNDS